MGNALSQVAHQMMQSHRPSEHPRRKSETFDISEDILIHILSFVPAQDLLNVCCRVCRQWNSLISGHIIWKRKCQRDGKIIPKYIFKNIPKNYYRNIYLRNPYGRNLLRNPFGAEKTLHWVIMHNDGEGWIVENEPAGADPVPDEAGGRSCFATSYGTCQKFQSIDLLKEGINAEILDEVLPDIEVGEWHAARFDCGSLYSLKVVLLDARHLEMDVYEYGPFREEQWAGRAWSKVEFTFSGYPPGVRYIIFEHSGEDTQYWAGHYGSKMTGGYAKVVWKE